MQPFAHFNLIKTIRDGQNWLEQLTTGKVESIGELASLADVTNMMYRAFLAPDIIRSIMNGIQPIQVTGNFLKKNTPLPLNWEEQRSLLGFKCMNFPTSITKSQHQLYRSQ